MREEETVSWGGRKTTTDDFRLWGFWKVEDDCRGLNEHIDHIDEMAIVNAQPLITCNPVHEPHLQMRGSATRVASNSRPPRFSPPRDPRHAHVDTRGTKRDPRRKSRDPRIRIAAQARPPCTLPIGRLGHPPPPGPLAGFLWVVGCVTNTGSVSHCNLGLPVRLPAVTLSLAELASCPKGVTHESCGKALAGGLHLPRRGAANGKAGMHLDLLSLQRSEPKVWDLCCSFCSSVRL